MHVGSSNVLSRALAACSVIVPASGKRNIDRSDSTGRNEARVTTSRAWSTPRLVAPSGSTTVTSGWTPPRTNRHDRHSTSWSPRFCAEQGRGEPDRESALAHRVGPGEQVSLGRRGQLPTQ